LFFFYLHLWKLIWGYLSRSRHLAVVDRSKNRWVGQHFQTGLRSTLQVTPTATLPHHILGHEHRLQVPRVSNHQRAKCEFVLYFHKENSRRSCNVCYRWCMFIKSTSTSTRRWCGHSYDDLAWNYLRALLTFLEIDSRAFRRRILFRLE
jgi:hypothetical protein